MKKILLPFVLLLAASAPALAANPPAPPPQLQPKFLILDRQLILRASKVGQDVARQAEAAAQQAKADITGQQRALQTEGQQLQQQIAILAPDVKAQRVKAFEAKQVSLEANAGKKQQQIQLGILKAQETIAHALEPILQGLMQQRGANLILDKQAVVYASQDAAKSFDITQQAVQQLDQKLPSLKVDLSASPPPPAGKK
jgi:outer membrane protein